MSRSLGDCQCRPYVISVPDIISRPLGDKDLLLLLATDGVWDVMSNEEAVALASGGTPAAAAARIVAECTARWDKQAPAACHPFHVCIACSAYYAYHAYYGILVQCMCTVARAT